MNRAETNLFFARWLYPDYDWLAANTGKAIGALKDLDSDKDMFATFDIHRPSDKEKVIIKLRRDHEWEITPRKRSGENYWQATRQGLSLEHGDLVILLKQLVESILEEKNSGNKH